MSPVLLSLILTLLLYYDLVLLQFTSILYFASSRLCDCFLFRFSSFVSSPPSLSSVSSPTLLLHAYAIVLSYYLALHQLIFAYVIFFFFVLFLLISSTLTLSSVNSHPSSTLPFSRSCLVSSFASSYQYFHLPLCTPSADVRPLP